MSSDSVFEGDLDFCVECGSILPLPGLEKSVTCRACGFSIDVKKFDGLTTKTSINFNNKGKYKKKQEQSASGRLVDRECVKCGNPVMTYATLQTRSADEGQTVFYSCPECQYQENENS